MFWGCWAEVKGILELRDGKKNKIEHLRFSLALQKEVAM